MANKAHMAMLKQGVRVWNQWRTVNPDIISNFSYTDPSDTDLSGADLSGFNLSGFDLSYTDLSGANLNEANLFMAHLNEANLFMAHLSRATSARPISAGPPQQSQSQRG